MKVNGAMVEIPKYDVETRKWHCPHCNSPIDIYNEEDNYYYTQCEICGCIVANRNFMEERR